MQTNQLKRKNPNRKRMIVARGGKRGKTAGRGGKGQSARAGNKRRPEMRDIIKRIPKLRGRGVNLHTSIQTKPAIVNIGLIEEIFSAGDNVNPTTLLERGIISTASGIIPVVKILGDGEITKKIIVSECLVSLPAKEKIEKAGGVITVKVMKIIPQNVPSVKPDAMKKVKSDNIEKSIDSKNEEKKTKKSETTESKTSTKEVKKQVVKKGNKESKKKDTK